MNTKEKKKTLQVIDNVDRDCYEGHYSSLISDYVTPPRLTDMEPPEGYFAVAHGRVITDKTRHIVRRRPDTMPLFFAAHQLGYEECECEKCIAKKPIVKTITLYQRAKLKLHMWTLIPRRYIRKTYAFCIGNPYKRLRQWYNRMVFKFKQWKKGIKKRICRTESISIKRLPNDNKFKSSTSSDNITKS